MNDTNKFCTQIQQHWRDGLLPWIKPTLETQSRWHR